MIILDFLKGILIGIANVIPGLSGATIAVVLNVYERIINFFSDFFTKPFKVLKDAWAILGGIVVGIVISLFGLNFLVQKFPVPTLMFIVGLIIGAIPQVYQAVDGKKVKPIDIVSFVLMILVIVVLPFIQGNTANVEQVDFKLVMILIALGAIAAGTMIIPGVSGSMVLLALGYYLFVLGTVETTIISLLKFKWDIFFDQLLIVIPLGIGVLLGLVLISKLIRYLIGKYPQTVTYAILGLLVASPFAVIYSMVNDPEIGVVIDNSLLSSWIFGGLMLFLGAYLAVYLAKLDSKTNKKG